jgi:hypothetical protein
MIYRDLYVVTCPTCGARARQPCHTPIGNWVAPHRPREQAARRKRAAKRGGGNGHGEAGEGPPAAPAGGQNRPQKVPRDVSARGGRAY